MFIGDLDLSSSSLESNNCAVYITTTKLYENVSSSSAIDHNTDNIASFSRSPKLVSSQPEMQPVLFLEVANKHSIMDSQSFTVHIAAISSISLIIVGINPLTTYILFYFFEMVSNSYRSRSTTCWFKRCSKHESHALHAIP